MCTTIVRFDPDGRWPLLLAFVRDEDRGRETQPPGFWWPRTPTLFGARDARAGGTWLAVDTGDGHPGGQGLAFVQNQIGPHVTFPEPSTSPTRGELPPLALDAGPTFHPADGSYLRGLERYQPFQLVTAMPLPGSSGGLIVDWWQWSGHGVELTKLQPGIHIVASRGVDLPGERERRADQLERFAQAAAPAPALDLDPRAAWGEWIELLDGRDARPDDLGGLVVHSVSERPGFGTVGATLVAIGSDGRVRWDTNDTTDVDPDAWSRVAVPASASVAGS